MPSLLPPSTLILATRGSPLALQQARWVQEEMERRMAGVRVKIQTIQTTGDRVRNVPLPQIGGKGLFTQELEDALREGRAHFAVHSLKDLPTELPDGLILACVPRREDSRDVLVSRDGKHLADLPPQARVGTSSIRRAAQLRRLRPDLEIKPLRGNLNTRLRKLREGVSEAIVVAAAGMIRMGFGEQITEYFAAEMLCPAVGQGALGIEARAGDAETLQALAALEDPWARLTAAAERALLENLGGGCQVPIAASATRQDDRLRLAALVVRPDGSECIQATELAPPGSANASGKAAIELAEALGKKTAESLLRQGAGKILQLLGQERETLPTPQSP
ncbi:MAG: hydroxymethylbilane synthase [Acidobacteria bacterium RIFCSPLOWO2_12_FULL_60_22]|nr:MAG: hydroxymethylbilane synthase [Acidobacteria bacterium RIFCSPLOWO2_12_FULL_60_22]